MTGKPEQPVGTPQARGHRLGKAAVALPFLAAGGWLANKTRQSPTDLPLPHPLPGERRDLTSPVGGLAYYVTDHTTEAPPLPPLLLIHSINAAGSAYEMRPIYEQDWPGRTVYALELPGYGFSERRDRLYTPRVMTDAILVMLDEIRRRHGAVPVDAMALSLSSEFLARAATERPDAFRSIALISPTGFDKRGPRNGPPGLDRGMPALYKTFTFGLWRRQLFELLTSRVSIRYFLEKTWGSKQIDEGLMEYDYLTTHQPGAEHAPYSFISGFLFSNDISRVYDGLRLPVWFLHGVRGDFTDYTGKRMVEGRPNWTIDVVQTGALPQFEMPDGFRGLYESFLTKMSALRSD